jgi:hypothetical protein
VGILKKRGSEVKDKGQSHRGGFGLFTSSLRHFPTPSLLPHPDFFNVSSDRSICGRSVLMLSRFCHSGESVMLSMRMAASGGVMTLRDTSAVLAIDFWVGWLLSIMHLNHHPPRKTDP